MDQQKDKKIKILTIEDDEAVRLSISAYLEDSGYIVVEAENGEKGIEVFKEKEPDAVLIDLNMPGIHGLDVIKSIRSVAETTPMIVISGAGELQSAIDALHSGACDYLMKPIIDMKLISTTIDKCIERSRKRRQELLYRQHLEEELKRKSEEIERKNKLLSGFSKKLEEIVNSTYSKNSARRLRDVGSDILMNFGSHLLASGGSIYIREENGLRLINSIEAKHAPDLITFPLRAGSPFKRVLDSGKPILVDNIDSEDNMVSSGWDGYNDSSFMIFPLPDAEGRIMGLLSLHNKTTPPFIAEDKEMGLLMSIYYKEASRSVESIEALNLSESRYKNITENSAAIIFSFSIETRTFDFINNAFEEITGFSKSEVIDKDIKTFVESMGVDETEDVISHFESLISGRSSGSGIDYRIKTANGKQKWVFQKTVSIFNSDGFPVTIDGIITEYNDQKEIEEQLKNLIDQKDLLLNEINHRVKNNMQIISSMINLEAGKSLREQEKRSLLATDDRISAMALVHDNIYDADLTQTVDMKNYISKLICKLSETRKKPENIRVKTYFEDVSIDLDRAVICGLIINEIINNAFTHAFPGKDGGIVELSFKALDEIFRIEIMDSGIGFHPDSIDKKLKGLGIEIVNSLISQLHGGIEYVNKAGTAIKIEFPREIKYKRKEY